MQESDFRVRVAERVFQFQTTRVLMEQKRQRELELDKSDLFRIAKYQCKVSEGFEALGKSTHIHTVYTYIVTPYIFEYT